MVTRHTRYYNLGMYNKNDAVDIMGDWNDNNKKIDDILKSLDGVTSGVAGDMETAQTEIDGMLAENEEIKDSVTLSQGKLIAITPALNVLTQVASAAKEKALNAISEINSSISLTAEAENAVKIANDTNSANANKITDLQNRISALENK